MEISRTSLPGIERRPKIQTYGAGRFTVAGTVYAGGVLVLPWGVVPWPATQISGMEEEALALLLAHAADIDVCLMGCGPITLVPPPELRQRFKAAGLRVDAMTTASACRTYNVLMSEGRAVAAALIPV